MPPEEVEERALQQAPPRRSRIAALDVLRGFALCGILLANVQPIANAGGPVVSNAEPQSLWMGVLVDQRFFPIFSLLFGIGFSLLLESVAGRTSRPRVLVSRRLLVLLAVGLLHMFLLWQGDILTIYAGVGLLVLLPSTWLPRWAVAVLAPVLIVASLVIGGDRIVLVAGLFLLGSALTRYDVVRRMGESVRGPLALGLAFAAAAAPTLWVQIADPDRLGFGRAISMAGLAVAGLYVCVMLILLRTPLRSALQAVFAPLGRMALTNYLTATVLVLAVGALIGTHPSGWSSGTVLLIAAPILAAQWLFSTLWLSRFRQGPLEWLWRWATYGTRPAALR